MQEIVNDIIVNQFGRSLKALRGLLKKAQSHAQERKFDENLFLQTRLAPDMFPFVRQVQIVSDTAKATVARLSGKTAPSFPDEEKTLAELVTRVDKTLEYLNGFSAKYFANYTSQKITFPWNPGVHMTGDDYLSSFAIPNFFFHFTTAYDLLRLHGVQIGKGDYMGEMNWKK